MSYFTVDMETASTNHIIFYRVLQHVLDKHHGLVMVSRTFVMSLAARQGIRISRAIGGM